MNIERTIQIDKSAAAVWQVLATDFDQISLWMRGVVKSYETDGNMVDDSPMSGRVCHFDSKDNGFRALETITKFDEQNRVLDFVFYPQNGSAMLPVIQNNVSVQVKSLGSNKAEVIWKATPDLKLHGKIMSPLLKMGLNKGFDGLLSDLKYYMENGTASPEKVEADRKIMA